MPRMASSTDDVFEFMGLSKKEIPVDKSIFSDTKNGTRGILIKRCSDPKLINVLLKAYALGYSDQQIIALCELKNFDLNKYLDTPPQNTSEVFSSEIEGEASAPIEQVQTQPKVTTITSDGIIRTLQIFCEKKASTIPADACTKCPHLGSVSYEAMQVVCKFDPTQETT